VKPGGRNRYPESIKTPGFHIHSTNRRARPRRLGRGTRSDFKTCPRGRGHGTRFSLIHRVIVMSSTHDPQPETQGAVAHAHAPQVAVRDGNRLLCPCCGKVLFELNVGTPRERGSEPGYPLRDPRHAGPTRVADSRKLEELPQPQLSIWDEIVDQQEGLKQAAFEAYCQAEEAEQEAQINRLLDTEDPGQMADRLVVPIDPKVDAYEIPAEDPPPLPKRKRATRRTPSSPRPRDVEKQRLRRQRERRLWKMLFESPPTHDVKRLRAWTFYHWKRKALQLQALIDRQQSRVDRRISERCGEQESPSQEPPFQMVALPRTLFPIRLIEYDLWSWMMQVQAQQEHAQADLGVASGVVRVDEPDQANERGPPLPIP